MRMALLGASGCGKSVTLKCIAGIMTPDRGHIILDGETLFDSEKHINLPPQKRQVGYLFQQYAPLSEHDGAAEHPVRHPLRQPCQKTRHPARERPQRSTSSRTNACATSESEIARGTVFADIFADQAFTPSV